jgi:hypothetical protein
MASGGGAPGGGEVEGKLTWSPRTEEGKGEKEGGWSSGGEVTGSGEDDRRGALPCSELPVRGNQIRSGSRSGLAAVTASEWED